MEVKYKRDELYHHGIVGMKWGVRRYQNKDGSLTKEGKARQKQELKDFKEKEIGKLNKKKSKTSEKLKNNKLSDKKIQQLKARSKQIDKEIKLVSNYKFKDMSAEKVAIGKKVAVKTAIALGTFAIPLAPDAVGIGLLASASMDKTKYRNKLIKEQNSK